MRKKTLVLTGNEKVEKCMREVAPLHVSEAKMNTHKGMIKVNLLPQGMTGKEYKQYLLYGNVD